METFAVAILEQGNNWDAFAASDAPLDEAIAALDRSIADMGQISSPTAEQQRQKTVAAWMRTIVVALRDRAARQHPGRTTGALPLNNLRTLVTRQPADTDEQRALTNAIEGVPTLILGMAVQGFLTRLVGPLPSRQLQSEISYAAERLCA
jgi:hypothetical protein